MKILPEKPQPVYAGLDIAKAALQLHLQGRQHALLGLERFPGDDTIRNFFLRFSQAHIVAFWRPLWKCSDVRPRALRWTWIRRCSVARASSKGRARDSTRSPK